MLCRFLIGREKPGEQSEVAQLIQQTLEQERWQREVMEQRYSQYMEDQEVSLQPVYNQSTSSIGRSTTKLAGERATKRYSTDGQKD